MVMAAAGLFALTAVATGLAALGGCGGKRSDIRAAKAVPYVCESCGYKFGIPLPTEIPPKQAVFPPIVCPQCKKQTAVQAFFCTPKGGGEPKLMWYNKYTDAQIKQMEEYRDSHSEEELKENPPDRVLNSLGEFWLYKLPGSSEWQAQSPPPQMWMKEVKSPLAVFPDDWPIIPLDQVKQR
jgi:hypothetical protein